MNYEDRVTKQYIEDALAGAGAKIAAGQYTGNGAETRTISVGFTPKAVWICDYAGIIYKGSNTNSTYHGGVMTPDSPLVDIAGNAGAHVTAGGFVVTKKRITNGSYNYDHYTNEANVRFYYLAIG